MSQIAFEGSMTNGVPAIETGCVGLGRWEPVEMTNEHEADAASPSGSFADPMLPAGYEQFDVMAEPTSLPVDEAREAAAIAAIEGVWCLS